MNIIYFSTFNALDETEELWQRLYAIQGAARYVGYVIPDWALKDMWHLAYALENAYSAEDSHHSVINALSVAYLGMIRDQLSAMNADMHTRRIESNTLIYVTAEEN